jgi:hypothetical protein
VVDFIMLRMRKQYEIVDGVIGFVAINVVNRFIRCEFSTKKMLHDISMFHNVIARIMPNTCFNKHVSLANNSAVSNRFTMRSGMLFTLAASAALSMNRYRFSAIATIFFDFYILYIATVAHGCFFSHRRITSRAFDIFSLFQITSSRALFRAFFAFILMFIFCNGTFVKLIQRFIFLAYSACFHIDLQIKTPFAWLAGVLADGTRIAKQKAQYAVYRYDYRLSIRIPSAPGIISYSRGFS